MELVAHLRLSKQTLIDLVFFCGVPVVLAMLSAVLGPYAAIMGAAGAAVYVLSLAIVPWWLTGLATHLVSQRVRLPCWLIVAIGAIVSGPSVSPVRVCRQFDRRGQVTSARSERVFAGDVQRGPSQIRRLVGGTRRRSLDRLRCHFP